MSPHWQTITQGVLLILAVLLLLLHSEGRDPLMRIRAALHARSDRANA